MEATSLSDLLGLFCSLLGLFCSLLGLFCALLGIFTCLMEAMSLSETSSMTAILTERCIPGTHSAK
jgi:hypothetical protein